MRSGTFALALCISHVALIASAQAFEAVSLHPLPPGAKPDGDGAALALDPFIPAEKLAPALLSVDVTLADLVVSAYAVRDAGLQPGLLKQLPDWAQADALHLTARLPSGTSMGTMRTMLQTLLRERFAFASHEKSRPAQVLLLQVDPKQGTRLISHTATCTEDLPCGTHMKTAAGLVQVEFIGQTLDEVAGELGGYAWYWGGFRYGPVVNATTLKGRFDGTFTFAPLLKADVAGGPTVSEGLRHDLGLRLQKGTRPITQRIIDHVERPTFD